MAQPASASDDRSFFGHPRGLSTLFFTEMWERFSYYGMRALLLLYMTAPLAAGGLGFDEAQGGAIYGLYTSMVYMTALPGGWIADRLIGQRKAVLYGGILIAAGHFSLAVPSLAMFYFGLFQTIYNSRQFSPAMELVMSLPYAALPVGFFIMFFFSFLILKCTVHILFKLFIILFFFLLIALIIYVLIFLAS